MSKEIDDKLTKKLGTETPNIQIMTLGMALKLRDLKCPPSSYSYIIKNLTDDQRVQFNFI
jgi:hypothetical protein